MPEVRQIVDWIQMQTRYNRDGTHGILPFLNEAQNLLCMVEADQFVYVDTSIGDLPYLTTVSGQYAYDLPGNVWRVNAVVVAMPVAVEYDRAFLTNYGYADSLQVPVSEIFWGGRKYQEFHQVRSQDKKGSTPCKLIFTVDPGDQTGLFQYIAYTYPTQITSMRVAPAIPDQYHMSHWAPATVKLIEAQDRGSVVEAREYVYKEIRSSMWREMNRGEQGYSGHVARRSV